MEFKRQMSAAVRLTDYSIKPFTERFELVFRRSLEPLDTILHLVPKKHAARTLRLEGCNFLPGKESIVGTPVKGNGTTCFGACGYKNALALRPEFCSKALHKGRLAPSAGYGYEYMFLCRHPAGDVLK